MPPTFVFADTNVFMHCKFFDELDWRVCATGTDDVILTVPPLVVRELEKHKVWHQSPRMRHRVQSIVRKFEELVKDDEAPVPVRDGCRLLMTTAEPQIDFAEASLAREEADDVFLAAALEHSRAGHDVVVVSGGGGVRRKARSRKLRAMEVPEDWKRGDEPDDRERELLKLRQENARLKEMEPKLSLTAAGEKNAAFVLSRPATITLDMMQEKTRGVKDERKPMRVPSGLNGMMVDADDVRTYNTQVEEYHRELEKYASDYLPVFWAKMERTAAVPLHLENTGTAYAEDVDVIVTATADGRWRLRAPTPREYPKPPEKPLTLGTYGAYGARLNPLLESTLRGIRPINAPRPNIVGRKVDLRTPQVVRFQVGLIKPGRTLELPTRYFEFAQGIVPLKLTYELAGKNVRAPQTGTINIRYSINKDAKED